MKRLIAFVLFIGFFMACNDKADSDAASTTAAPPPPVQLPYELQYKSWEMGDPANVKLVLDMYENWENNQMEATVAAFADSTTFDFPSGNHASLTSANILDSFKVWRSYSGTISTDVISALSIHSTDKNEDWVTIWSFGRWTDRNGKADSSFSNDNWQIKNGKITYLSSLEQKSR